MTNNELSASIKALLDEYQKAINELIEVIRQINDISLLKVVDNKTIDADCKSIQTILSHIISSGFGYTIYMENSIGLHKNRPEKEKFANVNQYIDQLKIMFVYCENFFKSNPNLIIEQTINSKKIKVSWGQQYDIEQLMEHAIVHILRHRRQIERFIQIQNESRI